MTTKTPKEMRDLANGMLNAFDEYAEACGHMVHGAEYDHCADEAAKELATMTGAFEERTKRVKSYAAARQGDLSVRLPRFKEPRTVRNDGRELRLFHGGKEVGKTEALTPNQIPYASFLHQCVKRTIITADGKFAVKVAYTWEGSDYCSVRARAKKL